MFSPFLVIIAKDSGPQILPKGILKQPDSKNTTRRVAFDPLALLLDASLEGELDLVIHTAGQVIYCLCFPFRMFFYKWN